jgi:hypothetical protein
MPHDKQKPSRTCSLYGSLGAEGGWAHHTSDSGPAAAAELVHASVLVADGNSSIPGVSIKAGSNSLELLFLNLHT